MIDYSSIVISSKVQLSRNLNGFMFPSMFEELEGVKVLNKVTDTLCNELENYKLYKIATLNDIDKNIMREREIISGRLIDAENFGGVVVSSDESISIMVNETDHIKEQCSIYGLNLILAYDKINEIDNKILSKFDIAYDDSLGFLTSCVENIGTGLSASVRMFLPALQKIGKIPEIRNLCMEQGFDIAPLSFDGIKQCLYYFEIRNTQTIGRKETDIIFKLSDLAIRISKYEIQSRNELLKLDKKSDVIDSVYRAWGVLTNCYKISASESQNLISELKMGIPLDIIKFKDDKVLDYLFLNVLPFSLSKTVKKGEPIYNLDEYRARFLGEILKSKRVK